MLAGWLAGRRSAGCLAMEPSLDHMKLLEAINKGPHKIVSRGSGSNLPSFEELDARINRRALDSPRFTALLQDPSRRVSSGSTRTPTTTPAWQPPPQARDTSGLEPGLSLIGTPSELAEGAYAPTAADIDRADAEFEACVRAEGAVTAGDTHAERWRLSPPSMWAALTAKLPRIASAGESGPRFCTPTKNGGAAGAATQAAETVAATEAGVKWLRSLCFVVVEDPLLGADRDEWGLAYHLVTACHGIREKTTISTGNEGQSEKGLGGGSGNQQLAEIARSLKRIWQLRRSVATTQTELHQLRSELGTTSAPSGSVQEDAEEAENLDNYVETVFALAMEQLQQGEYSEAARSFSHVLQRHPEHRTAVSYHCLLRVLPATRKSDITRVACAECACVNCCCR